MSVKNILLSATLIAGCFLFCGCSNFSPTTEPLPEQKEINTARDYTYHEKVSSLPTMPTKSLDPDFVDRYIDEDKFHENAKDVESNMATTKAGASEVEGKYSVALTDIETAQRDQEHYSDLQSAIKSLEGQMTDTLKERIEAGQELLTR